MCPAMQQTTELAGWKGRALVAPAGGVERAGGWRWLPQLDTRPGNACIGIVVGCALSLPFWAALLLLVYVIF